MNALVRQLRHGGPSALAAAKQLLQTKPKLTKAELAEVKLLLPQLKDLFGAKLSDGLSTLLTGHELAVPVPVEALKPSPEKIKELGQLHVRFSTDLQLVRPQLVNHPALSREEKATRLFGFLVPFAEVVVKLPPETKPAVAQQLAHAAQEAGFSQLVDVPTQRDGVQVARELFASPTPEAVREQVSALRLDAPSWERSDVPKTAQPAVSEVAERTPLVETSSPSASQHSPTAPHPGPLPARGEGEPASASGASRSNKRLGPQLLWNALHLFRDDGRDGRDSAAQRDAMNRLAVGMALALGMLTLLAVIVFALR